MSVLWDSKVTFVSVLGISLVLSLFDLSLDPLKLHILLSHFGGKKGKKKREDPKRKKKDNNKPPADFKPIQRVQLVFLYATGRGGWALLFSLPLVLRGWGPGLGHTIHSFSASGPGLL